MMKFTTRIYSLIKGSRFSDSGEYWQSRYTVGGRSGPGSQGRLAHFKASFLNELVRKEGVTRVAEFGCGDGSQLLLSVYPQYIGIDVSETAIGLCESRFASHKSKKFVTLDSFRRNPVAADLCLSLDVIYHLVEDSVFEEHMRDLFGTSTRFVAIYSSNSDRIFDPAPHVRHRRFTDWIERNAIGWVQLDYRKNPYPFRWWNRRNTSHSDMFVFHKSATPDHRIKRGG